MQSFQLLAGKDHKGYTTSSMKKLAANRAFFIALATSLLIFIFGYFLRVMFLPQKALTFGYDQARDAVISQQILKGDLKIQGPPASTPGLFHGVFYYYFLALSYLIGNGSPIITAYWISFLNALTIIIVFFLTYLMTKKTWPALVASFLFAISFEGIQYATWLSNPTIAVWTVPLMYLGLWVWVKEKNKFGPVAAALGLGLSIQAEVFLLYHIVPLAIWLLVGRKSVTKKQIVIFFATLILTVSTMILNEVKFGFRSISGFIQLATGGAENLAYSKSVGDYIVLYLNQIGRIFAFNSYPGNIGIAGSFIISIAIIGILKYRKEKVIPAELFLATWLFSHITVVSVGGVSTPFLMVGIGPAVSILLALFLYRWWQAKHKVVVILILLVVIFGNLSFVLNENKRGSTLFAIQKDMLLSKELQAVDYTYEKAGGDKFSINTLTSPLWVNIVWDYLYKWHGNQKYGYLPEWHGRDQVGQLGGLSATSTDTEKYFLILEPMGGIPLEYLGLTVGQENTYSKIIEEKAWGELIVQYRERTK